MISSVFEELVALLKEKHLVIGSCESLTGGLFASSITSIAGASSVFRGAIVTYQNECKINVANVDSNIIETYGVISKECAIEMSKKAKHVINVDICVSFTGNAGPTSMEGKPAGTVFCAISGPLGEKDFQFQFTGERNNIREMVVCEMCKETIAYINNI